MICWQCDGVIDIAEIMWMETTEAGDERPFCPSCIFVCKRCHKTFVNARADKHTYCEIHAHPELDDSTHSESDSDDEISVHSNPIPPLGDEKH